MPTVTVPISDGHTASAVNKLIEALEDHDALTATGYNLIRVGERSGKLASMLDSLAKLYEEARWHSPVGERPPSLASAQKQAHPHHPEPPTHARSSAGHARHRVLLKAAC